MKYKLGDTPDDKPDKIEMPEYVLSEDYSNLGVDPEFKDWMQSVTDWINNHTKGD